MDINELKGLLGVSEDDKKGALNMGLLQAGLGILANNTSRNAGPALAKGGMMGLQGYQQSLDTAQKEKLQSLQQMQLLQKLSEQETARKRKEAILNDPSANPQLKKYIEMGGDIGDLAKIQNVPEGGKAVSPLMGMLGGDSLIAEGNAKQPKTTIESVAQPNGKWADFYASNGVVDTSKPVGVPYAKRATASETSIGMPKIEVKTGESVATQIGPILKEARTGAQGAVKMFDIANRIESAIKSGNVISGPLASASMKVRQMFNPSGSSKEIQETRKVIRGLAEGTVNARKALEGQGSITEQESAVAAKAESGDIDDLTIAELQILTDLNRRAAKIRVDDYSQLLDTAKGDKATAGLAKFFAVPGTDAVRNYGGQIPSSVGAPPPGAVRVKR